MKRMLTMAAMNLMLFAAVLSGCAQNGDEGDVETEGEVTTTPEQGRMIRATAQLQATQGNTATGIVEFAQVAEGVRVVASVQGLAPGEHGIHVHEFGDCSAPDAESAGGHYNPLGQPHGAPTDSLRHMGDLGNITVEADSTGRMEWVDPVLQLTGENSIIGKAVIVHENPDDFTTQPTGNAGGRLACGVIEQAQQ